MKCQVCNQESGEYSLCKSCFDLMQEGKVVKCKNCDNWYNKDEVCSCFKTNGTPKVPVTSKPETSYIKFRCNLCGNMYDAKSSCPCQKYNSFQKPETTKNDQVQPIARPNKEKNPGCIAALIVLAIGIVILCCLLPSVIDSFNSANDGYGQQNPIVSIIKDPPIVTIHQPDDWLELVQINFDVACPANYKKVVIEMTIYGKNDTIVKQKYLIGENYKKGNTYQLTYQPSLEEVLKARYVSYDIIKYE